MATNSETVFGIKIILCGNLIFAIGGLMYLIAFAIIENEFSTMTYAAIGVFSPLLIILSYLGLFSKLKNNNLMTVIISGCLLIMFIAEMSIADMPTTVNGLDSLIDTSDTKEGIQEAGQYDINGTLFIQKMMRKYSIYYKPDVLRKLEIHLYQRENKCCGWEGPEDWEDFLSIPPSCCANTSAANVVCNRTSQNLYTDGCFMQAPKMNTDYEGMHAQKRYLSTRFNRSKTINGGNKETNNENNTEDYLHDTSTSTNYNEEATETTSEKSSGGGGGAGGWYGSRDLLIATDDDLSGSYLPTPYNPSKTFNGGKKETNNENNTNDYSYDTSTSNNDYEEATE